MSYLITVPALAQSYLTDPLAPGGPIVVTGTRQSGEASDTLDGELRQFAGQRTQLVAYDTETNTVPIVLAALTGAEYAQVMAWKGRTLLLRGVDGSRYFGGYLSVSTQKTLLNSPVTYDADISFLVVSYTDTV